jgi:hypothetical protein
MRFANYWIVTVTVLCGCASSEKMPLADKFGCQPPTPTIFKKAGIDFHFAQSTFKNVVLGDIDVKAKPEIVNLASQAATDATITEYIRCLSVQRDHYTAAQSMYLQTFLTFMQTKPTPDQFIVFQRENKFPDSTAPVPAPKLSLVDVRVSEGTRKPHSNRPEIESVRVGADLDFVLQNSGNASVSISRIKLIQLGFKEEGPKPGEIVGNEVLASTADYDADLSTLKKDGDDLEIIVAHFLPKDTADRFKVLVTAKDRFNTGNDRTSVWRLQPVLVTSNGEVKGKEFTVRIPMPRRS